MGFLRFPYMGCFGSADETKEQLRNTLAIAELNLSGMRTAHKKE